VYLKIDPKANGNVLTVNRTGTCCGQKVRRRDVSRNDVIRQDGHKLVFVFRLQKGFDGSLGEGCKGFV
jgi:hypothetical protein